MNRPARMLLLFGPPIVLVVSGLLLCLGLLLYAFNFEDKQLLGLSPDALETVAELGEYRESRGAEGAPHNMIRHGKVTLPFSRVYFTEWKFAESQLPEVKITGREIAYTPLCIGVGGVALAAGACATLWVVLARRISRRDRACAA